MSIQRPALVPVPDPAPGSVAEPAAGPLFRIERGCPSPEELAALTAVLMAVTAGPGVAPDDTARKHQVVALWRRPERVTGFDGPRTWRAAA
ncbi:MULTISPECIES: acyl-CoA carboxylase subunit epsilon [Streptomyces]|uniref:acyl-CoA carboxylase subunit epsilon n=1 Tax=Streptomyces TaxID=1883 RepID=UPI000BD72D81|nr:MULTISPECIES: acyl-CoA carboxylase subunit epsilon [Streptomyces]MCX4610352.1 acyl-CoA carboxylase subunit epsilon [Streptomyces mirabilis]MCX5350572.1 acyl-CoA carboxylase subunit epsilon [Streptomyces mirabilis]NMI59600.1 acyl-CoA carboxylase subunit epsilon [Streptomyces sp. RLA2-12]QDN58859.1 acyl-CoA carboxylase subunit epsilon [Streptomyces sp. S1D4-20]QDN68924.1 acyl-CoA carboxylase subunit epsilon [Streptomyces sp. S1D4-14]